MIESFSKKYFPLLHADEAWYFASALVLAACLTIGILDFRKQSLQVALGAESNTPHSPNTTVAKPDSKTTYTPVAGTHWDFFGVPEIAPTTLNIEALPETALDLELIGTFTSDAEFSSAVIKTENGETQRVFLRQSITDGVMLHVVNEKEVVIDRGSVLETLKLYEFDPAQQSANRIRPSSRLVAAVASPSKRLKHVPSRGYQNTVEEQLQAMEERRKSYVASDQYE